MKKLRELETSVKAQLVNELYNTFVRKLCDEDEFDTHGHGKTVPYIGWYWRDVDFVGRSAAIGNCGDFIGIMENNKWGYPHRMLTPEEFDTFVKKLDTLIELYYASNAADKDKKVRAFADLWDWFQTLTLPNNGD